jgi:hypothetical protein
MHLGTDYPYPWTTVAVDHILETPSRSDDEPIAILGAIAPKLLRIKLTTRNGTDYEQ